LESDVTIQRFEFCSTDDFGNDGPAFERLEADGEYVRYEEHQSELAALREELAQLRILAADQGLNLKRVKREFDASQQRLTAAEQRNAELVELLHGYPRGVPGFAAWADKVTAALNLTESVAYQSREIGESDWADCTKAEYDRCGKDPHMDTRIKPTESGASE
jgi:DNA repair ATPase RecN